MQLSGARKKDQQESLCEELLRERAAVLSRAGFAVEDALAKLANIEKQIEDKLRCLSACPQDDSASGGPSRQAFLDDMNTLIDEFNAACQKAEIQFYYLIVTREALGLRRHETVQRLYLIPPKKKKMQAI
ncbi:MAG: hypothetical protein EG826_09580 [Deltaproteobacteria bacterium]|nr:hypothetical protein [Deltaproteobacteria bacterium]